MSDPATLPPRPDHEGDEAGRCGGCGSRNMVLASDGIHAACVACARLQEIETRNWPASEMCGNCAFRKGSPERADPYRWAELQELVENSRHEFHCHKGLAMQLGKDGDMNTASFAPPDPKTGRVTVCAGWINARVAHLKRQQRNSPAPGGNPHRARGGYTGGT